MADTGSGDTSSGGDVGSNDVGSSYSYGDVNVYSGGSSNDLTGGSTAQDAGFGQGSYGADIAANNLSGNPNYWGSDQTNAGSPAPSDYGKSSDGTLANSDPFGFFAVNSALSTLNVFSDPNIGVPGYSHYDPIAHELYQPFVNDAATQYNLDPKILTSLIRNGESQFDPFALSTTGAIGLGQLEPGTAAELGVDPFDPIQNIYGSAAYLRKQLDTFGGNYQRALVAYNAGPAGGVPAGSVEYAMRILNNKDTAMNIGVAGPIRQVSVSPASVSPSAPSSGRVVKLFGTPLFTLPSAPSIPSGGAVKTAVEGAVIHGIVTGGTPDVTTGSSPMAGSTPAYTGQSGNDTGNAVYTPVGYNEMISHGPGPKTVTPSKPYSTGNPILDGMTKYFGDLFNQGLNKVAPGAVPNAETYGSTTGQGTAIDNTTLLLYGAGILFIMALIFVGVSSLKG